MKPKEEDLEQILLNNASLDELIKMKIEKEFKSELVKANKKPHKKTITDISKVPKGMVFQNKQYLSILTAGQNRKLLLTVYRQKLCLVFKIQ